MDPVVSIVWLTLIGVGVAAVCLWYSRTFPGKLVRKLLEIDATSPETAVSLETLHCRMTPPLRLALREGGALQDLVLSLPSEDGGTLYYLSPDRRDKAQAKYRKEGTGFLPVLFAVAGLLLVGLLFHYLYPVVSDWLSGYLAAG